MRPLCVAAAQSACSWDLNDNLDRAESLVRDAASQGANLVLLQELFASPYFCIEQNETHLNLAAPLQGNAIVARFADLARELGVLLPLSYFEQAGQAYFNSLCMIDADGSLLGNYRKAHIPNGIGYQEKHYFTPGDSGFQVWDTAFGRIGAAICWDQWFPEAARAMALEGAEILCYPTAIGSEPAEPEVESSGHWTRVMQGHAAANLVPVIASNRVGVERCPEHDITFYGSSFICDHLGALCQQADRQSQSIILHTFDLEAIGEARRSWGLYRDRRPDLYKRLMSY